MLNKWLVLLFTSLLVLTACQTPLYNQTEANVATAKLKTAAAIRKSDNSARTPPPLLIRKGPYVDTTPINLSTAPSWLSNRIVIRGDQLPFSYYSRTIAAGAGSHVLTKYQTGLDPALGVTMNYSGTVKGALDLLAVKTGYVYAVHNNKIYWQAFITRTFDIAFMPGSSDYLVGKTASGGAGSANTASPGGTGTVSNYVSSDSSDSEYSNLKGTLSIWKDLDATIKPLLSPDGKVVISESTTSVTVRDRPTNVELVSQYIANLNRNLAKQVLVKVQVIEVNLESAFNFGIDWQIIVNAFHNSPFVINGNYGTPVAIQALSAQRGIPGSTLLPTVPVFGTQQDPTKIGQIPAYTILLNALNQQGKASIVTEPRVVCLNNQVSVVRIVEQKGYAASIQNTSLAGSGSTGGTNNIGTVTSQITPGTIITGLTLYILPKILKDKIYLQVNADLSVDNGVEPFESGGSRIQLPNITEKSFNQRSVIRSGDTLILAGFKQLTNRAGANQFITSQALGGKAALQRNRETIILITPIILAGNP